MKLGDTVLYYGHHSNGATVHPAIVTRIWTDDCVNLQVLPDCGTPFVATSVVRYGVYGGANYFEERS